jgi:hypothetical protein
MDIQELARVIDPTRTVLLLGAGASIPSGAPSGADLAQHLARMLKPTPEGADLAEIAGIFENRMGRADLVAAVRSKLSNLQPTGGLLALPSYAWRNIYSTNFDQLVERSYAAAAVDLRVIRSNYDFSQVDRVGTTLFKIHGCVSQDIADGSKARMVLTEADYDEVGRYRQALFNNLSLDMTTADTLIVGQSLADAHLRQLAKEVGGLKSEGIPGRVFLLAYRYDEDRAALYARNGITVVGGGLEQLLHAVSEENPAAIRPTFTTTTASTSGLTQSLLVTTTDVAHASSLTPDAIRLFNGSPATYADIRAGLTITRTSQNRLDLAQQGARGFFVVVVGAAGVGKTTLARALLMKRVDQGFQCWEHRNAFALDVDAWLEVDNNLRAGNRQGVLLIDDAGRQLREINKLVEALGARDRPHLRIVITTSGSQWKNRTKSRYFFSRGSLERLSRLTEPDIDHLINLVDQRAQIRVLVEDDFLQLGRGDRVKRLRDRCSSDMFVCLKNIFHNDSLDNILLQEFAELNDSGQDIYRAVAALQAMGGQVHRQLIVKLLGIDSGQLGNLLSEMEDTVHEYDIDPRRGLYGWQTRHDVVARVIATYKFADQSELTTLLENLIQELNPSVHLELETARAIAAGDMGIARVSDRQVQADLLNRLILAVPGERTPRRRLVRLHLDEGNLLEADRAIAASRRDLGRDTIITRYDAVLSVRRAEQTDGILDEDRRAMLLEGERLARECIRAQPLDRFNYRALADVGGALARKFGDTSVLESVVEQMRAVESDVGDPDFGLERRRVEATLRRYQVPGVLDAAEEVVSDDYLADSEG